MSRPAQSLRAVATASSSSSAATAGTRVPSSLSRDVKDFLHHYPSLPSKPSSSAPSSNLAFYKDEGPARPSADRISALHQRLKGNYSELESSHSFIQWIFPIREMGMNWQSQPLELHEVAALTADQAAMDRLVQSYRLMLDFYGLRLVSLQTGEVARSDVQAPSVASWRVRFANLQRNPHNFLRITRILKSLSEFGFEHLNAPWLLYFLVEQARGELDQPSLVRSMDTYWRWCIRADADRNYVVRTVDAVRRGELDWTEQAYQDAVRRRHATGSWVARAETRQDVGAGPSTSTSAAAAPPSESFEQS